MTEFASLTILRLKLSVDSLSLDFLTLASWWRHIWTPVGICPKKSTWGTAEGLSARFILFVLQWLHVNSFLLKLSFLKQLTMAKLNSQVLSTISFSRCFSAKLDCLVKIQIWPRSKTGWWWRKPTKKEDVTRLQPSELSWWQVARQINRPTQSSGPSQVLPQGFNCFPLYCIHVALVSNDQLGIPSQLVPQSPAGGR